jgi:hypothetical protein
VGDARRDLLEQFQPFRRDRPFVKREAGNVAPGRARLSTKPARTGSLTCANTIGMVRVACVSDARDDVPPATMTSGFKFTSSAA